jgi:hypothetical protein
MTAHRLENRHTRHNNLTAPRVLCKNALQQDDDNNKKKKNLLMRCMMTSTM